MDNTNAAERSNPREAIADRDGFYHIYHHQLSSISCVQHEDIDIGADGPLAHYGPRPGFPNGTSLKAFFEPSRATTDELKNLVPQQWFNPITALEPQVNPKCKRLWFTRPWSKLGPERHHEMLIDRFGGAPWICMGDGFWVTSKTGLLLPMGTKTQGRLHWYSSDTAFFPNNETNKPHLACIISDTYISPTMLRSEVHGAMALIKYQLTSGRCANHHFKPVMLFTFQGEEGYMPVQYARLTQAYFDRNARKIVLRQSRLLDLRGPVPTDDAWLLLRWMLNTPIGDTLNKQKGKEPEASR